MKISLSWLFDYIDYPLSKINVDELVHLFNTRTAEIEHYDKISFDLESVFVGKVSGLDAKATELYCSELKKDITVPSRSDAMLGKYYLITRQAKSWKWTCLEDFSSDKEGLFPAVAMTDKVAQGSWRQQVESSDYILDVDNKSINHRPDLWGHYGIAREVATFMDLKLKPLDKVLHKQKVVEYPTISKKNKNHTYSISIEDAQGCSRFAGLHVDTVQYKDSDISTAFRLLSVGAKPINSVVDLTNYVMFDVGHPMHVFDAKAFTDKSLVVRKAKKSEKLTLLDGQELSLRGSDLVVANDKHPVALAGIMGGQDSGFSTDSTSIFLEAAGFDPTVLRRTAQHFKLRTEASMRFEKHLDPMQNVTVLQRFLYLAKKAGVLSTISESVVSVGRVVKPVECKIEHSFFESRIGTKIEASFIKKTLKQLGFDVTESKGEYKVGVPTTRMTKDISIEEDILEEVVRMYGYENITYDLPSRTTEGFSIAEVQHTSQIKRHLAFACGMHEVRDYLFYDESFLRKLPITIANTVSVKSSVSENWTRLVTSLIPHLLKNISMNAVKQDSIRFFEMNNIWNKAKTIKEQKSLAGIMFHKQGVDFYDMKAELQGLWDLLHLEVIWRKPSKAVIPWYDEHKAAELFVGKRSIGFAGMMDQEFMRPIIDGGQAFIFELDAEFLIDHRDVTHQFKSWSKYQDVTHDISMLVPLDVTADQLQQAIAGASSKICSVQLVDFFEKDNWADQRSLTFRYQMSDSDKTLDKQEIDAITQNVQKAVKNYDAQIR